MIVNLGIPITVDADTVRLETPTYGLSARRRWWTREPKEKPADLGRRAIFPQRLCAPFPDGPPNPGTLHKALLAHVPPMAL